MDALFSRYNHSQPSCTPSIRKSLSRSHRDHGALISAALLSLHLCRKLFSAPNPPVNPISIRKKLCVLRVSVRRPHLSRSTWCPFIQSAAGKRWSHGARPPVKISAALRLCGRQLFCFISPNCWELIIIRSEAEIASSFKSGHQNSILILVTAGILKYSRSIC